MIDILIADLDWFGQDVYLVGAGPNGAGHYSRIPPGKQCLVVNRAVMADDALATRNPVMWCCSAPELLNERWFLIYMPVLMQARETSPDDLPVPVFALGCLTENYPDVPYFFLSGPSLWDLAAPECVMDGFMRSGAGIAGRCLQLAYQKKARRVIMIGVDMKGKGYFDGSENTNKQSIHPDGSWVELSQMNLLAQWMKPRGTTVVTMTETLVNVEMI